MVLDPQHQPSKSALHIALHCTLLYSISNQVNTNRYYTQPNNTENNFENKVAIAEVANLQIIQSVS